MIYLTSGKLSSAKTYDTVRNAAPWLSIAKFLETDPLKALGLEGGWMRSAAPAEGAPLAGKSGSGSEVVSSLPDGNHGDNNV